MRTGILAAGVLLFLTAGAARAQEGRYWRDHYRPYPDVYYDDDYYYGGCDRDGDRYDGCYEDGPYGQRRTYMERFRADERYHSDEWVDDDAYWADRAAHDRSRKRLRNTFLGAGIVNELFNKGASKSFIRGASVGGFVLNEIFNR